MKSFRWKSLILFIPILLMALLFLFSPPTLVANDDVYMMKVFSGKITGEPYYETAFISVLVGFPFSLLYRIVHLPWFFAFQIGMTLYAQYIVMKKILELLENSKFPKHFSWIALLASLGLLFYTSKFITYTTVASLVGVASILKLFQYKNTGNKKTLVLSAFLLILSVAIRFASGALVLAFWGIAYLYLLYRDSINWKTHFLRGASILAILGLCFVFDWWMKHYIAEPEGYYDFMQAQADFVDYPKDDYDLPHMQELMEKYQWDRDLYNLAAGYFTMDERLITEAYQAFNQYAYLRNSTPKQILLAWKKASDTEPVSYLGITLLILLAALQFCVVQYMGASKKTKWATVVFFLANALLFMVAAYILGKGGRLVARSILAILLPFMASLLGILGEGLGEVEEKPRKISDKALFISYAILGGMMLLMLLKSSVMPIALLAVAGIILALQYDNKRKLAAVFLGIAIVSMGYRFGETYIYTYRENLVLQFKEEKDELSQTLENYALANEQYTFVTDLFFGIDFRSHISKKQINNILFWGGTNIHSHIFNEQLAQRGIEAFDLRILTKENVRLIIPWDKTELLGRILASKNIFGEFEFIEQVDRMQIYQFHQKP